MTEEQFSDQLQHFLENKFEGYQIVKGKSLLYKLIVDPDGEIKPRDVSNPSRGQYAFQTDLLIRNNKVPLVVVELKYGGFSTHDVLTYSSKALKHKEVYPYLRYGFVVGRQENIDKKFFTHNVGFDFALMINNLKAGCEQLRLILERQIGVAEKTIKILKGNRVSRFESYVDFS
jgi:hypothetical protein